ncbi:MAG TPA: hypothetical protein ENH31_08545, partial [Nitrospirae bacterium]|nr:hypothetical protein [Nitrospirota bacterium]
MDKKLVSILALRDRTLELLNGKMGDFFLGGGTALSLYHLKHRESFDLDFFTKDFSSKKIKDVISNIETGLDVKAKIEEAVPLEGKARILRCFVPINGRGELDDDASSFKIDFIEDQFEYIKTDKTTTGDIPVFSMENICLRKIYATCGVVKEEDELGRPRFVGGRQAAK